MKEIKSLLRQILTAIREHKTPNPENATYIVNDGQVLKRNADGSYNVYLYMSLGTSKAEATKEAKRVAELLNSH